MLIKGIVRDNVLIKIVNQKTGKVRLITGHNIITNAGDIHYAKKVVGENSDLDTLYLRLGTGTDNPTKDSTDVNQYINGSAHIVDSGFPQRNYTDEGNSNGGENVITYRITYDVGDVVSDSVSEGALVDDPNNPNSALNHFLFSEAFEVTDQDQLIVFINHSFVGV